MFEVYKESSGGVKRYVTEFDTEEEAVEFCDSMDWEYVDENRFVWDLDYREVRK
jgi:hypothetical protein